MNTRSARAIVVATFAMDIGFSAIAAGAAVAAKAGGLGASTIALGGAVSSLATVVGALSAGRLPHRVRAWCASLLVLFAGAALSLLAGHEALAVLLVPLRVFDGLGLGIALTASETLLFERVVDDTARRRALGACAMATAAGFVAGPAFTAVAVVAGVDSIAAAFVVAAVAAVATVVLVRATIPSAAPTATTTIASTSTSTSTTSTISTTSTTTWSTLWARNRVPWLTTLSYGTFQGAGLIALPLLLLEVGVDDAGAVAIVAVYAAGMFVGTAAVPRLGTRFGDVGVMVAFCIVGGAAIVGVGTLPVQWLLVRAPLSFVAGATVASLSPLSLAIVGRVNSAAELPRANSIYNALYGLGNLLGPLLLAVFVDVVGTAAVITALGVGFVVHAVFIATARAVPSSSSPSSPSLLEVS
ncbi:MAG TPA: MFS transporter [Myxococcota bacterium]